jgi:hypothetical protein
MVVLDDPVPALKFVLDPLPPVMFPVRNWLVELMLVSVVTTPAVNAKDTGVWVQAFAIAPPPLGTVTAAVTVVPVATDVVAFPAGVCPVVEVVTL